MSQTDLRISALGVNVGVTFDQLSEAADSDRLRSLWSAAAHPGDESDVVLSLGVYDSTTTRAFDVTGGDFRTVAASLSSRVTLAAIEQRKTELVMLHACGVAGADGRVAAFVGPSGRGKTTLVSKLARAYRYVTDETVGVDLDGTVLAYRKPLSIIDDPATPWSKKQVSPDELGLLPLPDSELRIASITLIARDPEWQGVPEVTDVGLVDSLVELVPELSYLPQLDRPLQRLAGLIDGLGGVSRVVYRDAEDVVPLVPAFAERRPAHTFDWHPLAPAEAPRPLNAGEFARVPPLDAIEVDGVYLLLHDQHVRVLDGVGPAIWSATVTPATAEQITDRVVALVGKPAEGDPLELVQEALAEMVEAGLIRTANRN